MNNYNQTVSIQEKLRDQMRVLKRKMNGLNKVIAKMEDEQIQAEMKFDAVTANLFEAENQLLNFGNK